MPKAVAEKLRNELACSAYYALRRISCEIHGETVTLRGQVPSYFLKQMAQAVARRMLPEQVTITNRLQVVGAC